MQVVFSLCPGFHTGFELGGEHGGSRMIVAREAHSRTYKCACLLGGSGGMPPPLPSQENFEFRSSQIASDATWDKIVV